MKKAKLEESTPNFTLLKKRVFTERAGVIYIGGEKVTPDIRGILRDEAEYIAKSRLWEIFNASILNEAYRIALIQSKDFNEVEIAKMLHHWQHFFVNTLHALLKK